MEFMVSDSQTVVYINYNLVTKSATISFYIFYQKGSVAEEQRFFEQKFNYTLLH